MPPYVEHRLGGGLNLAASADRIGDDELVAAWECEFDEMGSVSSRSSFLEIVEALGDPIYGEGDAVLDGTRYRFSKAGGRLYRDGTDIGASTGEDPISVVVYRNYAYIADGTTFKRYSIASGLQDVGFSTPSAAATGTLGSGGLLSAGDYEWVYTYFNGVIESNFSPPLKKTATATQKIDLTVPVGPTGTTERRIYRTDLNGDFFFRIGELEDNATTAFEDLGGLPPETDEDAVAGDDISDEPKPANTIRENWGKKFPKPTKAKTDHTPEQFGKEIVITNLGILADWYDHDPPPADIRHLRFLTETLYGISGNSLRFTLTGQPEGWSEYHDVPIGRQDGETLMAIQPLGDTMICYTDAGIWAFERIGVDALGSRLSQIESPVGLAARGAVVDVFVSGGQPSGHLFLAKNGVHLFDGRSASMPGAFQKIAKLFEPGSGLDSVNPDLIHTAVAASLSDQVLLSYAHSGTGNDRILYVDLREPSNIKFAIWRQGVGLGFTTLHRDSDNKMIGGTADGTLYELLVDGSDSVTWLVKTKKFPLSGETNMEALETVVVDANLAGLATTLIVETDRPGEAASWTITGNGRQKYRRQIPMHFRGNSVSVQLGSTGAGKRSAYAVGLAFQEMESP